MTCGCLRSADILVIAGYTCGDTQAVLPGAGRGVKAIAQGPRELVVAEV